MSKDLPPPLDSLWNDDAARRPRRNPAPLTVDRVVRAAVELADANGLAGVSMARVAERTGSATMSLYRHVRNKDELVALMLEAAVGVPGAAKDAPNGWRGLLECWASDLLVVARRHPWTLDLPLARLPIGPNRSAWLDRSLQALADTALSEHEKAALVLLVNDYVFSQARFEVQLPDANAAGWRLLPLLVTAERYPALRRALDAGVFAGGGRDRDAAFRFGLDRILDGIEHLAAQRTACGDAQCLRGMR
jgi:AcrR family transcriptional regulator